MSNRLDDKALATLTEQYVNFWNEAEADARRKRIVDLWAADSRQVLTDPPQAMREAVAELAFPIPDLEVRGHRQLEARATRSYEMFIAPGEYVFQARGRATQLSAGLVGIGWAMVAADGTEAGGGYDILSLDADGRIRSDHQFIDPA
ncbi:hypothetical protein [Nocardia huaxiensis]|uniref:SnoaL-like domain-containing protein n=1 Tax=Nocardia huaxiensis TaxID=2755382 RepID=A0A7D6ZG23_9NOCA|nr:hypothetical protein [Nocardia huaxiensis]QLY29467.1 hypothetical protein H0264_30055 [Nocardia huaxiensis]UFS96981.1 hypothetical protein LPY97_03335 [Nocardia huaxiensis]